MQLRTTSTQRTYRYVRIAIVGAMLLLAVGVCVQSISGGALTSVSAAYYTPARNVFVGALCAVSVALLALSGRSIEQALLDIAAVLAPLIAIVPTPVQTGDVSGVAVSCPDAGSCVPAAFVPDVTNGMLSLAVVGIVGLLAAVGLAALQRTLSRALGLTFAIAGALVVAVLLWWVLSPGTFLRGAHNAATIGFFALIGTVATLAAVRPSARTARGHRALRIAYAGIAAGIAVALIFVAVVVILRAVGVDVADPGGFPLFFLGEAVALALFAAFWIVQTAELWERPHLAARPALAGSR